MDNITVYEGLPTSEGSTTHLSGEGSASSTEGRPALKQVPLSLIVAARNPRYTVRAGRDNDRENDDVHDVHDVHDTPDILATHEERDARVTSNAQHGSGKALHGNAGRADTDHDLEGLARSLGSEQDPRLAEPPVVEEMPDGRYRLCAGERRVEAARIAKWTGILCLVYSPMDPVRAHNLGLVENLHRLAMHPLEEISALCISRLLANADARGVGVEARRLLGGTENTLGAGSTGEGYTSSYSIIESLERLLKGSGWTPERPDVSWKAHLDDLGISMAPWERKRKLRMLNIEPALQECLRELDITEAALRALGTLDAGDQRKVVEALVLNPSLARKVRRVARARRDGFYDSIEDALAEVQGVTVTSQAATGDVLSKRAVPMSETPTSVKPSDRSGVGDTSISADPDSTSVPLQGQVPTEVQDAVLQLLECVDRFSSAMTTLRAYGGGTTLSEPWGTWSREALDFLKRASNEGIS